MNNRGERWGGERKQSVIGSLLDGLSGRTDWRPKVWDEKNRLGVITALRGEGGKRGVSFFFGGVGVWKKIGKKELDGKRDTQKKSG